MQLRGISLENFKAFKSEVTIPLRPITLLFGENSAGKSSIIRALSLIKQSLELAGPSDVLVFRDAAAYDDLGSFHEIVTNHAEKRITIGISIALDSLYNTLSIPDLQAAEDDLCLSVPIERIVRVRSSFPNLTICISFSGNDADPSAAQVSGMEITCPNTKAKLLSFRATASSNPEHGALRCDYVNPLILMLLEADSDELAIHDQIIKEEGEMHFDEDDETDIEIDEEDPFLAWFLAEEEKLLNLFDDIGVDEDPDADTYEAIKDRRFFLKKVEEIRNKYTNAARTVTEGVFSILGHEGLVPGRSQAWRADLGTAFFVADQYFQGNWADRHTSAVEEIIDILNDETWMPSSVKLPNVSLFIKLCLFQLHNAFSIDYMTFGAVRAEAARWYEARGRSLDTVGRRGEFVAEYLERNPSVCAKVNEWLAKLETGHQVKVNKMGLQHMDIFEMRLLDDFRQASVSYADVGSGIAQLLPIVAQSLASTNSLISIQQPELHIHPRLQADLGDFFVDCAINKRNCHFLIETHSEHLMLRLQRRIRREEISHKDVCVLYVARGEEGSTVTELRLDSQGEFIDDWPKGYFPERLREFKD